MIEITLTKLTSASKLLRNAGSKIESLSQVFPHIIGQKGRTKTKVEQDTGATITIPKKNSTVSPGSRDADVVVQAPTHRAAVSAATRLELLIENVLNSNKYAFVVVSV